MTEPASPGRLFTAPELFRLYELSATAISKTVFGNNWNPGHTLGCAADRIAKLGREAESPDLASLYEEALISLNHLINVMRGTDSGVKGELRLAEQLRLLKVESTCIGPVIVHAGIYSEEMDQIVVTRDCLFLLEAKNTEKRFIIDSHGMLHHHVQRPTGYDIHLRLHYKHAALRRLLADSFGPLGEAIYIDTCLVVMNAHAKVVNKCSSVDWYYPGELLAHIEEVVDPLAHMAALDIDEIVQTIVDHSSLTRFPVAVDILGIYRTLRELYDPMPYEAWCEVFSFLIQPEDVPLIRTRDGDPRSLSAA